LWFKLNLGYFKIDTRIYSSEKAIRTNPVFIVFYDFVYFVSVVPANLLPVFETLTMVITSFPFSWTRVHDPNETQHQT